MRKNDLIKLLQTIEGNPEIVLWNGLVGDYQNISSKLVEGDLVKKTLKCYLEHNRMVRCLKENNWQYQLTEEEVSYLTNVYKTFSYEQNNFVTKEDIKEKRYMKKRVIYIQPKLQNKKYYDRLGTIEY